MSFLIFDARYPTNINRATIFEACETFKEAEESIKYWGNGCVLYDTESKQEWILSENKLVKSNFYPEY